MTEYYCDKCNTLLTDGLQHLNTTVFFHGNDVTERMKFCNWGCFLGWIVDQADKLFIDPDFYFVGFPHLTNENVKDFLEAGVPVTIKQLQFLNVRKE